MSPKYSVVIPVYNRPDELADLLASLEAQTFRDFEVIIVEDGSKVTAEKVYEKFSSRLSIRYLFKPNSGPGPSRNAGFQMAMGKYLVVFDSDCELPPDYFAIVERYLQSDPIDAWGGPDRGHEKFTALQQAMAYTMSSLFTTGGIRGGKKKNFQPRSYNMGMSREVFQETGGFHFDRAAEDIELSIRIRKAGFKVALIPDAFVFHKRRTTFQQFFRQVMSFGKGRALVGKVHPEEIKVTHWLPTLFVLYVIAVPVMLVVNFPVGVAMDCSIWVYLLIILIDSTRKTNSLRVGLLSVLAAVIQLLGYGLGFLREKFKR